MSDQPDPLDMDRPRVDSLENPFDDDGMIFAVTLDPDEMAALKRMADEMDLSTEDLLHKLARDFFAKLGEADDEPSDVPDDFVPTHKPEYVEGGGVNAILLDVYRTVARERIRMEDEAE